MSAKTRKNEKNQYYKNMLFEQIKISDKINRDLFAFEGIDFLINQGWNKMEDFVPMLDSVIEMQPNKIRKVERAYELKKKIYIKMNKKKKEIMSVNNTLADYYIQKAKELDEKNIQSIFNKEEYLKRAIELYRNNGKPDRAKDLMKELLMVQKEMSKFMSPIFITFDKSEIEERFENLDFKESIKQLILYVSFYKIEDIKKSVLERVNDPLENAFGEIRNKNEKGNTLVNILPLDKNDPEKDTELLYKHMYHELSIFAEINGNAEYYQPKYDKLINAIMSSRHKKLKEIVSIYKSIEPGSDAYQEEGIPFIRISDISQYGISKTDKYLERRGKYDLPEYYLKKNEILFSKDGSVGIAYKVENDTQAITSSALLHLSVNESEEILPDYLTAVLNSKIVQLQAERDAGGSIIKHWKPSEIEEVLIPILDIEIQKNISQKVIESFELQNCAKLLLEVAKQAVEIAIEQNETIATEWLNDKSEKLIG